MARWAVLILGWAALAGAAPARAGAVRGAIRGSGNTPVEGAAIYLAHLETGELRETRTGAGGAFQFSRLPAGDYTVHAVDAAARPVSQVQIARRGQVIELGEMLVAGPREEAAAQEQSGAAAGPPPLPRVEESVTVTARRVEDEIQATPLPVSVVSGPTIQRAGAFNVNRLKELIPTVQFYSANPRNSAINIRGLGSPFGLANDGIDTGVGFYVDGVFYARPAAATLDFVDMERVEVLRGPQGTLFGKNTTAGAINVTTRRPTFTREQDYEMTIGNYGFLQAKGSISGPLLRNRVAGRLSFSGTQRDGLLFNVRSGSDMNSLNNLGVRGQVLIIPLPSVTVLLSADVTRQRPRGYAQVIAGVAPTRRPADRQWPRIATDLGYTLPGNDPFARLIDTDSAWRANQDMGGGAATVNWDLGKGVLTSITAWRFWDWNPANDRDFIGLPVTTVSAAPSFQRQFTQEVRYAGTLNSRTNFLVGAFTLRQNLRPNGYHTQEHGAAAARFLLAPGAGAETPGLLDGYGMNANFNFDNTSTAVFGQAEYALTERLKLIPGLRYNYDHKKLDYSQTVFGGLQTDDPALIRLQRSVLSPLSYSTAIGDHNVTGQMTVSFKSSAASNVYSTFATGFKAVGLNLGGVPADAAGQPIMAAAVVRPERVRQWEAGVKSAPKPGVTLNLAVFNTGIRDFQAQVVNEQVGVLRGYLANADSVRVRGIELDGSAKLNPEFTVYGAVAFTDGRYMSFVDAPPPLEDTGGAPMKDVSGTVLPGISRWAFSAGCEYVQRTTFLDLPGEFFARLDSSFRSRFSSSPSASRYLNVDAYGLLNPRAGFRTRDGWSVSIWARNLTNARYFEFLAPQPGNTGLITGMPGDQRTFGITLGRTFTGI